MRLERVAVLLLLLGTLCRGQKMTHEEEVIRTIYAKLSYADEVRIILDTLQHTGRDKLWATNANVADRALSDRLAFELSNFRFGKISAISDRKMGDFDGTLTAIGGEVLDVTPSIYNYSVNDSPSKYVSYVKFAWKPSPYKFASPAENWSVAKGLQAEQFEGKKYTDYVTYTVTVTLDHKSRTYNALMLFDYDASGKLAVYFVDAVTDSTAVLFAYEHSMYPTAFVEADLRTVPFIDKWLYDNARACKADHNEKDDKVDICCDPKSGRCGAAKSSLLPRNSRRQSPQSKRPQILPASYHISSLPLHPFVQASTTCSQFNVNTTFPHGLGDTQEHNDGQHNFTATVVGSCTYTDGATSPGPCNVQCSAQSSSTIAEFGSLSGLVFVHATAKTDSSGGDFANGGSTAITCLGVSAGTIRSCTIPCSTSVSITAGGKGNVGATISFPPSALWNDQNQGQLSCQPQTTAPTPTPTPPPQPPPPPGCTAPPGSHFRSGQTGDDTDPSNCSPIIVDLTGDGFFLTSAANGVKFDIANTGVPIQIAWTASSNNAFLVLDRNGNGVINSGAELFGNFTPQPASAHPNGFLALAQYDSNGDGVIDAKDPIYSQLRLWVDANHDGISQPGELHTLPEMGVFSISLNYSLSMRTDEFGNVFRYKANINQGPNGETDVGKKAFDVFFVSQ